MGRGGRQRGGELHSAEGHVWNHMGLYAEMRVACNGARRPSLLVSTHFADCFLRCLQANKYCHFLVFFWFFLAVLMMICFLVHLAD